MKVPFYLIALKQQIANHIVEKNLVDGPWIHTRSKIRAGDSGKSCYDAIY